MSLPTTADVVILGGGPAGAAAAWAIERAAPGLRLAVLERGAQLASGASLASLENFRTCWAAPALHRLMARSRDVFLNGDEYFGEGGRAALGIKQQGYLWLAFDERGANRLRAEVAHHHAGGLQHVEYLDAAAVGARHPWLKDRARAAKFDPQAGWLDSNALVYQLARATRATNFIYNVTGLRLLREGDRITGVQTDQGSISTPAVVIAAGAGSLALARTAGLELPLHAAPRQSFTTAWRHPGFSEDSPCVISAPPFPHVRPEAQSGAVFGWEYRMKTLTAEKQRGREAEGEVSADAFKDPRFPSLTLALLARQFGYAPGEGFADPRYLRGLWHRAGYYVYRTNAYRTLPDGTRQPYESQRAIIDRHPAVEGLFLSVAHVGHGIMSAPAGGEILAARLLGLPLPDESFTAFDYHAPYVEYDAGGLSGE
jgi:glycine/D-amino acid oxidase-like deaminating enzyme